MHTRPDPGALPGAAALAALLLAACSPGGGGGRDAPRASVAVEPSSGPPGTDVQVRVAGFPPDVVVDVGFGPPGSEHRLLSRTATDGDGSTAAAVRVPAGAVPGRPYVFVAAYAPSLLRVVDTFTVTAPAAAASDTAPAPPGEVRVTGRLTDEGVECPALRGDDGRLYTLAGGTGGFRPGDRVTVAGAVAEMSTCMQGTTIAVRTIAAAGR